MVAHDPLHRSVARIHSPYPFPATKIAGAYEEPTQKMFQGEIPMRPTDLTRSLQRSRFPFPFASLGFNPARGLCKSPQPLNE